MSVFQKIRYPPGPFLPDYPYNPNFLQVNGIKIHYIEEGSHKNPLILFLHGVPTWSFTFRKIIPECVSAGYHVIAPDLPGFGKSDKLAGDQVYTLSKLVDWMDTFVRQLDLRRIYMFVHDWGAITGLILASRYPERFSGIIACNGMLPVTGQKVPFFFKFWKFFCRYSPILPVGTIVGLGCLRRLSRTEKKGYDYPFTKSDQKKGIRELPRLIPLRKEDKGADMIGKSWKILESLEIPFLTVFSIHDPITRNGEKTLQRRIPGTKNQPHRILEGGHFLQEDNPHELSRIIIDFITNNP